MVISNLRQSIALCSYFLLMSLLPAGCVAPASLPYTLGEILLDESFDAPSTWSEYDAAERGITLRVEGGVYRGTIKGGAYYYGLHTEFYTDVAIEATVQVMQDSRSNGFGVMCRADPAQDGDGYYFLIGTDGSYTIRRGAGREVEPLISWTRSSKINRGIGRNKIRAVCIGPYLALYVNDTFIDSTTDDRYSRGVAGVALVATGEDELSVEYENMLVWEAKMSKAHPE